jgi:hypothetical protein
MCSLGYFTQLIVGIEVVVVVGDNDNFWLPVALKVNKVFLTAFAVVFFIFKLL